MPGSSPFHGRVAVVAGGGGGIGAQTCRVLADRGALVVVADVGVDAATETARSITDAGGDADPVGFDISDPASVAELFAHVTSAHGRVDHLVNVAADLSEATLGPDNAHDIATLPLDAWDRMLHVGLRGFVLTLKQALPIMVDQGGGAVVNVSSLASLRGDPVRAAYGVTKAGVNALTRHTAHAYGRRGVRCNAVAPGLILTPAAARTFSAEQADQRARHNPSGRLGTPADVAHAISFLLSDDAAWINGHLLVVDGGEILR